jgi:hypothetical protein
MRLAAGYRERTTIAFSRNEVTGAIGDSVTVLPIVVAVAVLTELSLAVMLLWFGVFQVVWGLYYGIPMSIEPMKALAALVIAGALSADELLLAGLLLAVVLLGLGGTRSLDRVGEYVGDPVVRGIQFGVALVLLETGIGLGMTDLWSAGLAAAVALAFIAAGYWNLSAFVVFLLGAAVALLQVGLPTPALPASASLVPALTVEFSPEIGEAALGQLGMTIGNAALAASVLVGDYFDRDVSPDELCASMGVMNLLALPFGAFPMCHGSGGIAGKYAFGARTAGANLILGVGYVAVALLSVGVVAAYPTAMLGVILALIALQLGRTSFRRTDRYLLVVAIGLTGLLANLAIAFVAGVAVFLADRRWRGDGRPT